MGFKGPWAPNGGPYLFLYLFVISIVVVDSFDNSFVVSLVSLFLPPQSNFHCAFSAGEALSTAFVLCGFCSIQIFRSRVSVARFHVSALLLTPFRVDICISHIPTPCGRRLRPGSWQLPLPSGHRGFPFGRAPHFAGGSPEASWLFFFELRHLLRGRCIVLSHFILTAPQIHPSNSLLSHG